MKNYNEMFNTETFELDWERKLGNNIFFAL